MIDHVWSVLCSRAVIDKESNNVSIQNVLERVTVGAEPEPNLALPIEHEVISFWTRRETDVRERAKVRIKYVTPSGHEFAVHEQDIDLTQHANYRTRVRSLTLRYVETGRHFFEVEIQPEGVEEWQRVASIPIDMRFEPALMSK